MLYIGRPAPGTTMKFEPPISDSADSSSVGVRHVAYTRWPPATLAANCTQLINISRLIGYSNLDCHEFLECTKRIFWISNTWYKNVLYPLFFEKFVAAYSCEFDSAKRAVLSRNVTCHSYTWSSFTTAFPRKCNNLVSQHLLGRKSWRMKHWRRFMHADTC